MANATSILPLSGSAQGLGIKVVATATAGTILHTTTISATLVDQVYVWATNTDAVDRTLTVEFGGVLAPDNTVVMTIPARAGMTYVIAGAILLGNGATSKTVRAFASAANVIVIYGQVLRVTP